MHAHFFLDLVSETADNRPRGVLRFSLWKREVGPMSRWLSPDYFAARERFREASRHCDFRLETFPLPVEHESAGELAVDVAWSGDERPARLVIVSSGLHGVEGFAGSAIQLAILQDDATWRLPASLGLILAHALNPFGFARLRRVNEDSVDLNRNFLFRRVDAPEDTRAEYQGCHPLYSRFNSLINPSHAPRRFDPFVPLGVLAILRYGSSALSQAIAGGQYEFPKGLFFGGRGPSWTHLFLREHLPEWVRDARKVLHLDIHTGLGPWGRLQLLLEEPPGSDRGRWFTDRFGANVIHLPAAAARQQKNYYSARGELGVFCQTMFPDRDYYTVCAEFGTYSALKVLTALRTENQAFHWGQPDHPATRRAKGRLLEVFAPVDREWRQTVLVLGLDLIRRGCEVL
jgi:hypothetical protein